MDDQQPGVQGRARSRRVDASWVIGRLAARAVDVLDQLQEPDAELLFFLSLPYTREVTPGAMSLRSTGTCSTT
jgi:hypothetical protein